MSEAYMCGNNLLKRPIRTSKNYSVPVKVFAHLCTTVCHDFNFFTLMCHDNTVIPIYIRLFAYKRISRAASSPPIINPHTNTPPMVEFTEVAENCILQLGAGVGTAGK